MGCNCMETFGCLPTLQRRRENKYEYPPPSPVFRCRESMYSRRRDCSSLESLNMGVWASRRCNWRPYVCVTQTSLSAPATRRHPTFPIPSSRNPPNTYPASVLPQLWFSCGLDASVLLDNLPISILYKGIAHIRLSSHFPVPMTIDRLRIPRAVYLF